MATMHGRSMQPTLNPAEDNPLGFLTADLLFLEKLSLRTYSFSRGDVVVFRCNSWINFEIIAQNMIDKVIKLLKAI